MARKALLVGINDYPGTQNDLQGCVNDTTNLYDVLVKYFGFAPADIVLLSNSRARRTAILDGLKSLVAGAGPGDSLVFHYSGHGSQVRDVDGDELEDGKDEVLCPYDFDWSGGFIRDDELAAIIGGMAGGVHLEVVLDSCHSGTGTRELILDRRSLARLAATPLATDPAEAWKSAACIRPRYLAPPADIDLRADEVFGPALSLRRILRAQPMNHVLWAACRSNQFSADAEIDGKPSGAFTYFFCRHLRAVQGKVSRDQLLRLVRASLKHEGFSQVPQLEGPEGSGPASLFGLEQQAAARAR
ncbi:MAG TPA: caspase family protein [Spirochaetia bacterium]|nr:caspase family protein [Spirochaetia bacterium]